MLSIKVSATLLLASGVFFIPQNASAACQSCLNLNLPPYSVNVVQDTINATNSLMLATCSGIGAGFDVVDGLPDVGWCGEDAGVGVFGATSVRLYSTHDPALPVNIQNANWKKVNHVLNNKQGTF